MAGLCVTPVAYNNLSVAANRSRQLGRMLNGTWNSQFQNLTRQLRAQIISINSTKVTIAPVSEWKKKCYSNLFRSSNSGPDLVPWLFS